MKFNEIGEFPTSINKVHESCYRGYQVLQDLKKMIERGDSMETIKEYIAFTESFEGLSREVG